MNRRRLLVAAVACLMHWQAVYAQTLTVTPESAGPGVARIAQLQGLPEPAADEKREIVWEVDGGEFKRFNETSAYLWGEIGERVVRVKVGKPLNPPREVTRDVLVPGPNWPDDPLDVQKIPATFIEKHEWATYAAKWTVEGPVLPPPPAKTLAELAGDKAKALGSLYEALAKQADSITTAASFKAVHAKLLADQGLTGNGAAAAIDKRLSVVLADPLDHTKLRSVLQEFVAELGSLPPPNTTATAVTYVYEKDQGGVPPAVSAALSELNTATRRATTFEDDTKDADGDVPDQYKVPLQAARDAGLPTLVVTAGATVLKVVKSPTTKEQVLEAVQ